MPVPAEALWTSTPMGERQNQPFQLSAHVQCFLEGQRRAGLWRPSGAALLRLEAAGVYRL
jgi:hypothetical protein